MTELLERILMAGDLKEATPPVTVQKPDERTAKPPMYAVILHNDRSTNPEFVMRVMRDCFRIDTDEAMSKMTEAHFRDKSVVKVVSRDVAETQHAQAVELIGRAVVGVDYFAFEGQTGCELKFTVEVESGGGE